MQVGVGQMKKLLAWIGIVFATSLMGCGNDTLDELRNTSEPLTPRSTWEFDPANGKLPLPNDLLFNGTTDGTLNIPGEAEATNYIDPQIALGALDGWSTVSPITVNVVLAKNAEGEALTLLASSVQKALAVRLFEATTGGPLSSDTSCKTEDATDALAVCKLGAELTFGVDFTTSVTETGIAIVPLKPLKPAQSYLYVTTNLIQDSEGRAVTASSSYNLLKLDIITKPLATPEQLLLQKLVNSYEKTLASTHGVNSETITYSGLFTTQSIGVVTQTLKSLMLASPYAPSFIATPAQPVGSPTVAQALGLTVSNDLVYQLANATDVYSATIRIPIYGTCSKSECLSTTGAPLINGRWFAQGDNPLAVLAALGAKTLSEANFAQQANNQGVDPTAALTNPTLLVGKSFNLDNGNPVDASKHITKLNPIPKIVRYEIIPVLITIPNTTRLGAIGITQVKPATGWPSVITMHGLGASKEASLIYAGTYASVGVATISIDMPLHGERSFGLVNGSYTVSATDDEFGEAIGQSDLYQNGNPLVFVNIASTLTTRDNFNQGTADHLALRLVLSGFGAGSSLLDGTKVSAQGLSLGAIVGSSFATQASKGVTNPANGEQISPNPYGLNALSLVAPAGGLAGSFVGSPTFKPLLIASETFQTIFNEANSQTKFQPGSSEYDALLDKVFAGFIPQFSFAVQTAIDTIDPINYGSDLSAASLPVHLIEVVGDATNKSDQVLPNRVAGFPLSGTEPLITQIKLACVRDSTDGSGAVRFLKGHHSSIVSPAEVNGVTDGSAVAATTEMQLQVARYAKSAADGTARITTTNKSIIQDCN